MPDRLSSSNDRHTWNLDGGRSIGGQTSRDADGGDDGRAGGRRCAQRRTAPSVSVMQVTQTHRRAPFEDLDLRSGYHRARCRPGRAADTVAAKSPESRTGCCHRGRKSQLLSWKMNIAIYVASSLYSAGNVSLFARACVCSCHDVKSSCTHIHKHTHTNVRALTALVRMQLITVHRPDICINLHRND